MAGDLTIPENLLLLALNDESGERSGTFLGYALAGAGLAELVLLGRIREAGDPPKRLEVADPTPAGDAYLDACLEGVTQKGSGKKAQDYVSAIGGKSRLLQIALDGLVARGVLSMKEDKVLFIFTRKVYPEADPQAERALKARLEAAMFGTGDVEPRDSVIIALAHHLDILKNNFDKGLLKEHKARIKEIAEGGMLPATAAAETIQAMTVAVMMAAILPAIIVTTS